MNLKVAIVGLPNAGKSTLFNALLKKQVAYAANYPFATIEPNIGVVPVPDARLDKLADVIEKTDGTCPPLVPATVEFVDIAGLVKGASEGQGLGNKFLSHIRECHIICNVVRYFENPDIIHVAGDIDAKRDADIIATELILADLGTVLKQSEPRGVKDRDVQNRWQVIVRLKEQLDKGIAARDIVTDEKEMAMISDLHLLTMKPVLSVANVSEEQLANASFQASAQAQLLDVIFVSAQIESELAALSVEEQSAYLAELGVTASGLDRLIQKAYQMLGLISFLTCGVKESRAWTIGRGTLAPQAAGTIHTDFEKKFIKADICKFEDFVSCGGWVKAREVGRVRQEGKAYEMADGDVVEFKVGA